MKQFIVIGTHVAPTATLARLEDGEYVGIASGRYTDLEGLAGILNWAVDSTPLPGTVQDDVPDVCAQADPEPAFEHDTYTYRRPALDVALGFNQGSSLHDPRSVVADAAVFEEYLRNGATK